MHVLCNDTWGPSRDGNRGGGPTWKEDFADFVKSRHPEGSIAGMKSNIGMFGDLGDRDSVR